MIRKLPFCLALSVLFSCSPVWSAAQQVGDIARNFTLPYHTNASQHLNLTDFAGKVILIECFFADCPHCQNAATPMRNGVIEYYRNRGGNNDGLPVQAIHVNIGWFVDSANTADFIRTNNLEYVPDDFNYTVYQGQFGGTGTPHFIVINGVTNSSSHAAWEIIGIDTGWPVPGSQYASLVSQRITLLRGYIDSVKAGNLPPQLINPEMLGDGKFRFYLEGQLHRTNRIEATSDWDSWSTITNFVNQTGTVTITDPGAISHAQRFYRAVVQ